MQVIQFRSDAVWCTRSHLRIMIKHIFLFTYTYHYMSCYKFTGRITSVEISLKLAAVLMTPFQSSHRVSLSDIYRGYSLKSRHDMQLARADAGKLRTLKLQRSSEEGVSEETEAIRIRGAFPFWLQDASDYFKASTVSVAIPNSAPKKILNKTTCVPKHSYVMRKQCANKW